MLNRQQFLLGGTPQIEREQERTRLHISSFSYTCQINRNLFDRKKYTLPFRLMVEISMDSH